MTYKEKIAKAKKEERLFVFNKFNGRCAYCGDSLNIDCFHTDHIIPKRRYKYPNDGYEIGSDSVENLFPSCSSCNSCKSDLSIEGFRYRIMDRLERLNEYSSEYRIAKRFGLITEFPDDVVFYFEKFTNNG